jgi:hypothetical protein
VERLPDELLWTILGLLDVRTLCTARLVCASFHQSATPHIKKLQVGGATLQQENVPDFRRFPGLTHLAITFTHGTPLCCLQNPRTAPYVSHVNLDSSHDTQNAEVLARLTDLPKLRSVCLEPVKGDQCKLSLLPSGLEHLAVREPFLERDSAGMQDATGLSRLTNLRSLEMDMGMGAGASLGVLTSLRNLKSLTISTGPWALGVVRFLTSLTSLTWALLAESNQRMFHDIAYLTRLSRLHFSGGRHIRHASIACIAHLTSLSHLDMGHHKLARCAARSTALVPLTGLVSLEMSCKGVGKSLLSCLNIKALKALTLHEAQGHIDFVARATGLTRLEVNGDWDRSVQGLSATVARLAGLQDLSLHSPGEGFQLNLLLRTVTNLTRLEYGGGSMKGRDLRACGSLPYLRTLCLNGLEDITPACLPALQEMTGLTQLRLVCTGIAPKHLTPDVIAGFNAERCRRGWPDLKIKCHWWGDGEHELLDVGPVSYEYM